MIEIIDGKTPNGGVSARISYLDAEMIPCNKEDAINMIIQEMDKDGKTIMETWGKVTKK